MKTLTDMEMRTMNGGASKYVYCPICNYKSKSSLIERLFWSNARREMYLEAAHMQGFRYVSGQSVHR